MIVWIDGPKGIGKSTISKKVKKRCCNFPLLEEKGLQYQKEELIANK